MNVIELEKVNSINENNSYQILDKYEQEKYWEIVHLIGKMIVDITLSNDDKESNPLSPF